MAENTNSENSQGPKIPVEVTQSPDGIPVLLRSFHGYISELQILRDENITLKAKLSESREQKFTLQQQYDKLDVINLNLQTRVTALNSVAEFHNKRTTNADDNLIKKNLTIEVLEKQNDFLSTQLNDLEEKFNKALKERNELTSKKDTWESQTKDFTEKYIKITEKVTDMERVLRTTTENQTKQTDQIDQTIREVRKAKDAVFYYKQEYQNEVTEKKVMKDEITKLEFALESRKDEKEKTRLIQQIANLTKQVEAEKRKNSKRKYTYEDKLIDSD